MEFFIINIILGKLNSVNAAIGVLTLISKLLPIAKKPGSVFKRTRPGLGKLALVGLHEIQLGGSMCIFG